MDTNHSGLTLRAVLVATGLSLFLLLSTFYIAVKLGAAPWPIIFSVIVSTSIIKALNQPKKINLHEINVAQAGGSIGGLVAAGVAFTLPGILYLHRTRGIEVTVPDPLVLGILIAAAGLLGLLLSVPLKITFIDEENLPYPAGTAGAELLKLAGKRNSDLAIVMIIGALAGLFTLIRDLSFPGGFIIVSITSLGILLPFLPLPIATGAGYILGPRASFSWLAGALTGGFLLTPYFILTGSSADLTSSYIKNLGMGMVMGSGMSFLFGYILPRLRKIFRPILSTEPRYKFLLLAVIGIGFFGLLLNNVPLPAALLTLLLIWAMVAVAARMTGETNIDPLEQFGIFVTLLIAALYTLFSITLPISTLLMIAMTVSVACAVAGDAGHDYKSAMILQTKFSDIIKIDAITVLVTGMAAPYVFDIFVTAFRNELFTSIMPAPQAQLVADSLNGFEHPALFFAGFIIAFSGEILNRFLPAKLKGLPLWMPFGIGLFLGPGLALPIAIGAAISVWINKKHPDKFHTGILIAAGIMGAEGIAGFAAGALTIFGITTLTSTILLGILFLIVLLTGIWIQKNIKIKKP